MDHIIPDTEEPSPPLPNRKSTVFQGPIDAVARNVRKISSRETMAGRNYDSLRDNDRATVTMGDTVDGPMRVAVARPQNGGVANAGYIHDETVAPQPGVLLMSDNVTANPGRKDIWNVRKISAGRRPEIVASPADLALPSFCNRHLADVGAAKSRKFSVGFDPKERIPTVQNYMGSDVRPTLEDLRVETVRSYNQFCRFGFIHIIST